MPTWVMSGMSPQDVRVLLKIDRQEALHRFLRDYFIPMLEDRGYSFGDLVQAAASWAFDQDLKAIAHHLWDVAHEFYFNNRV
ncbi:hypothetical protein NSTC745_06381 [Nostoc sp. DSM 114161]|jgi:hypothetical protein|uniref:hypothetical protein n=1 Tax=Nostoc sp. DSM 114161 TaxID=3440143 RepID=UPI0040464173